MCVCMYVCIYIYVCVCIYIYMCMYIYMYVYIYIVPPLCAYTSQLGGTYILSLLFYTVNVHCDYSIYRFISSCFVAAGVFARPMHSTTKLVTTVLSKCVSVYMYGDICAHVYDCVCTQNCTCHVPTREYPAPFTNNFDINLRWKRMPRPSNKIPWQSPLHKSMAHGLPTTCCAKYIMKIW